MVIDHIEQLAEKGKTVFVHALVVQHDTDAAGAGRSFKLTAQSGQAARAVRFFSGMQVDVDRHLREGVRFLSAGTAAGQTMKTELDKTVYR